MRCCMTKGIVGRECVGKLFPHHFHVLLQNEFEVGTYPAWDSRRGEEFSEMGPNFLNYIQ